jgi:predicted nucleic acid-binding protein
VLGPLCQIYIDLALIESALQVRAETQYSFYDSLIIAAAIKGGCVTLFSEDLQHGQKVRNVQIVNPFNK